MFFSYISFDENNQPFADYTLDGKISRRPLMGEKFSLEFNTDVKYCTGWVDFENRRSVACPESATVEPKYESCLKCRNRTGFNPAFYHATEVSEQQEKINSHPHIVYLAHFAPGVIKVGISQGSRGARRLLEQGARAALELEVFPTAAIARQYEERISRGMSVAENINTSRKKEFIKLPFDQKQAEGELRGMLEGIEELLGVSFSKAKLIDTNQHFFIREIDPSKIQIVEDKRYLAGEIIGVVGRLAIAEYGDSLVAYDLKGLVGYQAKEASAPIELDLPSEQLTLF